MKLPFATVVVPVYNEQKYILPCIDSLLQQDYPPDKYEILVVDGHSNDDSVPIIQKLVGQHPNKIRLIDNPDRRTSKAWNLGIENAKGEVILLMSAHGEAADSYISLCVKYLVEKEVSNVGGIMDTVGKGFWGESIALATSNPFGVGNSKHRYAADEGYDDAGWPGAFWKKTLIEIGGFDENLPMNEDDDLNFRLLRHGHKLFYTSKIRVKYYCRDSLIRLWRQYFRYGYWKSVVIKRYGKVTSLRHFIPSGFVLSLILTFLAGALFSLPFTYFLTLIGVYFIFSFLTAIFISIRTKLYFIFSIPLIFMIIHFSYGLGVLLGIPNLFKYK